MAAAAAADALSAAVFDELYLHTTGAITAPPSEPDVVAAIRPDVDCALHHGSVSANAAPRGVRLKGLQCLRGAVVHVRSAP